MSSDHQVGDKMMMEPMYLTMNCKAIFLFNNWRTALGDCSSYGWYLVYTFCLAVFIDFLSWLKYFVWKKFNSSSSTNSISYGILLIVENAFWVIGNALIMLLAMTYSWGVLLTITAGKIVGYVLFKARIPNKDGRWSLMSHTGSSQDIPNSMKHSNYSKEKATIIN